MALRASLKRALGAFSPRPARVWSPRMTSPRSPSCLASLLLLAAACGDVDHMELELRFADPAVEAATRQLLFVVRQPVPSGESCGALWGPIPPMLGETARLVDYPNREDILVVPLESKPYTVFAYAYPERLSGLACASSESCPSDWSCQPVDGGQRACVPDGVSSRSLAGACGRGAVGQDTVPVELVLTARP